ncbi:KAP family P-loop NTPase fold protein [Pseudomonas sp. OTU750018]|uniref:KAP family P-loop NTPase fold protein n=1 Tax=Pseudomonas sp. OTU750018 TaxID=2709708 RepID=UPI0014228FCF|nr:P-loop NTPase fold protein [Pseudomonas sp. OTU750018]
MSDEKSLPWAEDSMDRMRVANFLTKYLDSNYPIKVLNINSPWGTGKTFFLNNWKLQLSKDRVCVKFNAWENDYSGDAFVSLVASIREQLSEMSGGAGEANDKIRNFTQRASKAIVAATPVLAKGIVKKFTGVDIGVVSEVVDSESLADAAEKAVEKLIENNKETLQSVNDFKAVFRELLLWASDKVSGDAPKKPAYIFIDELDRCRPTFAIELLERVKHFFDIDDCVFIIATDTSQLLHSVRAVYGEGFASDKYIKRFFDAEFTLDNSDKSAWIKSCAPVFDEDKLFELQYSIDRVSERGFYSGRPPVEPLSNTVLSGPKNLNKQQVLFLALAMTFNVTLRELDKLFRQIVAISNSLEGHRLHLFFISYLVFIKSECPEYYSMLARGQGDVQGACEAIKGKFPGTYLYFNHSNQNVHDIFRVYMRFFPAGSGAETEHLRNQTGHEEKYITSIAIDFSNHHNVINTYFALVDLAHRID